MSKDKIKLSFSLELKTEPVELDAEKYTLTELTGVTRDENMDSMRARMKFNDKGDAAGFTSFKGLQANLIHLSLTDKDGKRVSIETIQSWPASVQNSLFKAAQELSALEDEVEAKDAAKKD